MAHVNTFMFPASPEAAVLADPYKPSGACKDGTENDTDWKTGTLADSYKAFKVVHSFLSLSISFLRRFSSSLAAPASTCPTDTPVAAQCMPH